MESGRRKRSSSRSSSGSGESSSSRNGSSSSSRRRRSSSEGGSRRPDRTNFREDTTTGKKTLFLVLTLAGIAALCVGFYVEFDPDGGAGAPPQAQVATPTPTPTPTPAPTPADGSAPPEPPKNLGLTMEQYLDKLDSFGDHLQDQVNFSKSAVHEHVDWRCKVYNKDADSLIKSVLLVSATPTDKNYRVNAFFNKPDAVLLDRLHLLQRGDIVRVTGVIKEEDIHDIDADNLVFSN